MKRTRLIFVAVPIFLFVCAWFESALAQEPFADKGDVKYRTLSLQDYRDKMKAGLQLILVNAFTL